ncbi:Fe2+-dependent dioxygenase [Iodidimonas sp. SYSU 1G8]|uniref:Fe2+-dependent dioxygenase n=1 Tax=Iodidimonas sp. SYSU 1G8 TaxID=3133967 RepID=UPI0031FE925A
MLLEIEKLLTPDEVAHCMTVLAAAPWGDGRVTAGYQSARAKHNLQVPEDSEAARDLGVLILDALRRNLLFQSAALPAEIFPPLFNRYEPGHTFGTHVDNAIRPVTGTGRRIRTDMSATVFLSDPDSYDGGELVIEDAYGVQSVKLPAGHMILYPATSLHSVRPVTRGARIASFFWIQSLVADDGERSVLFDMDMSIQRLRGEVGDDHPALIALTGCYHNLLRRWAIL